MAGRGVEIKSSEARREADVMKLQLKSLAGGNEGLARKQALGNATTYVNEVKRLWYS